MISAAAIYQLLASNRQTRKPQQQHNENPFQFSNKTAMQIIATTSNERRLLVNSPANNIFYLIFQYFSALNILLVHCSRLIHLYFKSVHLVTYARTVQCHATNWTTRRDCSGCKLISRQIPGCICRAGEIFQKFSCDTTFCHGTFTASTVSMTCYSQPIDISDWISVLLI